jgi:type IV pilus assembly protein PilC
LDTILARLAEYLEATEKLKREIKGAMTYPMVSLIMIFGITIFLLVFIIPKFQDIFKTLGGQLPAPTRIVLAISKVMTFYWLQSIVIITGLYLLIKWWRSTDSGAYTWDRMMLKAPVFGQLIQKVCLSRFSKTFATLLRSGVPILGALEIVAATAGNRVVEEAVNNARESIRQGESLAKPLGESPVFPPMVVRMVAIGEKSGALEQLLEKISEFYDQQVEAMVESLTSLIEPLMIGVMGLMVGGIVLAVFLPIFKMQEMAGGHKK